ncbi:MAG: tRNA lysidine(34) synthetase TilS, partial [Oscillospiraceae bacterium]|nr:tRNA lysidine(34) synthetase TilS [Oscillospiraceae bacterium]
GTGLKGLCGIPAVRENIIRPLLEVTREEVLAFLNQRNAAYITDESNFSEEFTRNYLRLNIIPLLEKINPSLNEGVTKMCGILRCDEEYLHSIAVSALENSISCEGFYKTNELINLEPAVLNRIISLILSKNKLSPSYLRISQIASLLQKGGKVNLAKNKFAVVKNYKLYIETIKQNYKT